MRRGGTAGTRGAWVRGCRAQSQPAPDRCSARQAGKRAIPGVPVPQPLTPALPLPQLVCHLPPMLRERQVAADEGAVWAAGKGKVPQGGPSQHRLCRMQSAVLPYFRTHPTSAPASCQPGPTPSMWQPMVRSFSESFYSVLTLPACFSPQTAGVCCGADVQRRAAGGVCARAHRRAHLTGAQLRPWVGVGLGVWGRGWVGGGGQGQGAWQAGAPAQGPS